MGEPAIPESWIRDYIDQLLFAAGKLEEGRMRDALLLRADIVMDLVKAWRDHKADPPRTGGRRAGNG